MPSDLVITPTHGIDPRDALATSMFGSPGVYAVLVGSGVSTEAGILTGQRIMEDLIRSVAVNRGVDHLEEDPVAAEKTSGERPRWDVLLERLAPTAEARRSLLRGDFEHPHSSTEPITPTAAHEALAERIRARARAGRAHHELRSTHRAGTRHRRRIASDTLDGRRHGSRTPLAHAPVTVVKLHGDYLAPGLRNTEDELAEYGPGLEICSDRSSMSTGS